ncbi:unnamed protein product [Lactuca saligna]|uniref:Uncharacterized protein n=1 Tax=Lactuca saligna TaxID=75948 RepID=A0AA35YE63_LACSI|nr:unnamed protein product [Lactuca saligna]
MLQSVIPNSSITLLFVEMGVGYDQHGSMKDVMKAAMKACGDAITSSLILAFCRDSTFFAGGNHSANGDIRNEHDQVNGSDIPTMLEVSHVKEEIANDLRELQRDLTREMDTLNHEVDDVRAGQLDLSNMVADLKNHFCSMQASYVNIVLGKKKSKKVKWVFRVFVVAIVGVLTYRFYK